MPLYDYVCAACGRRFEVIHGLHDDAPTSCPLCGKGPVRKAIAAPAIHFKGSGWAKKERRAAKTGAGALSSDDSSGDGSSEGGTTSDKDGTSSDKGGSTSAASGSGSSSGSGSASSTTTPSGSTGD